MMVCVCERNVGRDRKLHMAIFTHAEGMAPISLSSPTKLGHFGGWVVCSTTCTCIFPLSWHGAKPRTFSPTISFRGLHVCCNLVFDPIYLFIILGLCGPVTCCSRFWLSEIHFTDWICLIVCCRVSVPIGSLKWSISFLVWSPLFWHGAMDPFEGTLFRENSDELIW